MRLETRAALLLEGLQIVLGSSRRLRAAFATPVV